MKTLYCNDWNSLISSLKEARRELGNPSLVWYRGQSDSDFKLTPTLFRSSTVEKRLKSEVKAFDFFKQVSSRLNLQFSNDWEVLFNMQHHWIPTRLLDWSEVVGIPLFFAAKLNVSSSDPKNIAIFVLDPIRMNEMSKKDYVPKLPGDDSFDFKKIYLEKKPFAASHPIAIIPNYVHNRLLAQKGVFTVHPDTKSALEDLCPECVVKIEIDKSGIRDILEVLEITNINDLSVFPDIQGAAQYIRSFFVN